MSVDHVKALLDSPNPIDGGRFMVLIALAEWANSEGVSWYPVADIARRARREIRATQYILRQLETEGYLSVERAVGRGKASRYTVNISALTAEKVQSATAKGATINAPIIEEKVQFSQGKGAIEQPEKVQIETRKGANPGVEKVQFAEEKVQFPTIKGASIVAPPVEPLINHQYNHQETSNAGARAREGANGKGATNGQYEQARSVIAPLIKPSRYGHFDAFWRALLAAYPLKGKRFGPWLKDTAQHEIPPDRWDEVVDNAVRYSRSDEVKRGKVAKLEKFLEGESWLAYGAADDEPTTPGEADTPPEWASWERDAAGDWIPLRGDAETGRLPYGAQDAAEVTKLHREAWGQFHQRNKAARAHSQNGVHATGTLTHGGARA